MNNIIHIEKLKSLSFLKMNKIVKQYNGILIYDIRTKHKKETEIIMNKIKNLVLFLKLNGLNMQFVKFIDDYCYLSINNSVSFSLSYQYNVLSFELLKFIFEQLEIIDDIYKTNYSIIFNDKKDLNRFYKKYNDLL